MKNFKKVLALVLSLVFALGIQISANAATIPAEYELTISMESESILDSYEQSPGNYYVLLDTYFSGIIVSPELVKTVNGQKVSANNEIASVEFYKNGVLFDTTAYGDEFGTFDRYTLTGWDNHYMVVVELSNGSQYLHTFMIWPDIVGPSAR